MCIEDTVQEILFNLCGEEQICRESSLQNDLALDSLAMVTLLIEIEETFDIQLDESDMNPFELNTVEDVIEMVKRYYGDANG